MNQKLNFHRKSTLTKLLNEKNSIYNMYPKLSIFETKDDWLLNKIFVHNIQSEVAEIVNELGGVAKGRKLPEINYTSLNYNMHKRSISIYNLKYLLSFLDEDFRNYIMAKIDSKQLILGANRSPLRIKFPSKIDERLCYIIGLLLGDGSLAGNSLNNRGNWKVIAFFDNEEHSFKYDSMIEDIFGIKIHRYFKRGCHYVHFASKVVHWYLRSFFSFHNGYKDDKIVIPERILQTKNNCLINACAKGLFDSDGCVVPSNREVKFASTSKKIVEQMFEYISENNITCRKYEWLKDPKYKMLYSVVIKGVKGLTEFKELIDFDHPVKKEKLNKIISGSYNSRDSLMV